jgi:Na+/proline symporter
MRLTLTSADWLICMGALAFNVVLGLYFALRTRQETDSSSFFLAGRTNCLRLR